MDAACKECGATKLLRYDQKRGIVVCTGCGRVAEHNVIDEGQEWRSFDNDDKGAGPNRAGGADDMLMGDGGMVTRIGTGRDAPGFARHNRNNQTALDRVLARGFGRIEELKTRLGVSDHVARVAKHFFKFVMEENAHFGKTHELVLVTCIFIACDGTLEIKDVSRATGLETRDLGRTFLKIKQMLKASQNAKAKDLKQMLKKVPTSDVVKRTGTYGNKLNLDFKVIQLAKDIAVMAGREAVAAGKQPATVAGAALFMATRLLGPDSMSLAEIAREVGMQPATISKLFNEEFRPNKRLNRRLLPEGYDGDAAEVLLNPAATRDERLQASGLLVKAEAAAPAAGAAGMSVEQEEAARAAGADTDADADADLGGDQSAGSSPSGASTASNGMMVAGEGADLAEKNEHHEVAVAEPFYQIQF